MRFITRKKFVYENETFHGKVILAMDGRYYLNLNQGYFSL